MASAISSKQAARLKGQGSTFDAGSDNCLPKPPRSVEAVKRMLGGRSWDDCRDCLDHQLLCVPLMVE